MNNELNLEKWEKFLQHPRLGEILLQHKKITISQLDKVLKSQEIKYAPIGQILINMNIITKDELVRLLDLQADIDKLLNDSIDELKNLKK